MPAMWAGSVRSGVIRPGVATLSSPGSEKALMSFAL